MADKIEKILIATGHNEHAASMRSCSVRKVVVANKMEKKQR